MSLLLSASAPGDENDARKDLAHVKQFFAKDFPGKKWQIGPVQVDSAEIREAYPNARFYTVRSVPPLPPGAALPELIKAHQKKMKENRETALNATVRIGAGGQLTLLQKPGDFNDGLVKVDSEKTAKTAAAAILMLEAKGETGLAKVQANQVTVRKVADTLVCQARVPNVMQGTVTFDANGKCVAVQTVSIRPLPPSAPPRVPPGIPR